MKAVIVIDSVPSYRRGFYESLLANPNIDLTVYCQSEVKGFNLQLIHKELGDNFKEVPFISSDTHLWAWQRLPVRHLWKSFDVYFFHGNPRIMSSLVWATLFRYLGKKVVIWGQAHTAGASSTTESIRLRWWRLFRNVLAYTDAEVDYLRQRGFAGRNVLGMNNGLNQKDIENVKNQWSDESLHAWQERRQLTGKTVVLSCARLVEKNAFHLMIESLPELVEKHPGIVWCVVGSGIEKATLVQMAERLQVDKHIIWAGEVYDENELAPWFLSANFLVHPGAIGLTLMHAFGYGLPVVTHDDYDFQMPEIAAMEDGVNGVLFRLNDKASFVAKVNALLDDPDTVAAMGAAALETVRTRFNTDVMAERFVQIAESAASN